MSSLLIVEDEVDVAQHVRDYFSLQGVEVHCATTGEEGLAILAEKKPELVLLDMKLGAGISGLEFLRRAKLAKTASRIIVVTAVDDQNVQDMARGLGAADYVTKPLVVEDLARVVLSKLKPQK